MSANYNQMPWQKKTLAFLVFVVGILGAFLTQAHAHVHVHGEGQLNLVMEDNKLVLSLTLPAEDVIGFERAPLSKEEKLLVDRSIARLKDMDSIFEMQKEARCKPLEQVFISADTILKPKKKTSKHSPHEHDKKSLVSGHSDIQVSYMIECASVAELKEIKILVFEHFPKIKKLKVQFVSEEVQTASVVKAKKPYFVIGK